MDFHFKKAFIIRMFLLFTDKLIYNVRRAAFL